MWVYFIECDGGSIYTGIAMDVAKRYETHVRGKGALFTKLNPPKRILAAKEFQDDTEARRLEWLLKRLPRKDKLKMVKEFNEAGIGPLPPYDIMEPFYNVTSVGRDPLDGITEPRPCTLSGIAKFDSVESVFCVYNEYVALRLGRLFNAPLADGVLSIVNDDITYISLELFTPGKPLYEPRPSQYPKIAGRYPVEAAALVAYDVLIGNFDRNANFMATLSHQPMMRAFDHSHALLSVDKNPIRSLQLLSSYELILRSHPFFGLVDYYTLKTWADRFARIDRTLIWSCCNMTLPFKNVPVKLQEMLSEAIFVRSRNLQSILDANRKMICREP